MSEFPRKQQHPLVLFLSTRSPAKSLPPTFKCAFHGYNRAFPIIINNELDPSEEDKFLQVLKEPKSAIGWRIEDLNRISPAICMHKILIEKNYKPIIQPQRSLNLSMEEVVKKEVMKLYNASIIYLISNSSWVSQVQVVPKKRGMTTITNPSDELIPTRTVTGWIICINYKRINDATRKEHFPLSFIDKMLERVADHAYYYFLDGYSGYNQIAVAPED